MRRTVLEFAELCQSSSIATRSIHNPQNIFEKKNGTKVATILHTICLSVGKVCSQFVMCFAMFSQHDCRTATQLQQITTNMHSTKQSQGSRPNNSNNWQPRPAHASPSQLRPRLARASGQLRPTQAHCIHAQLRPKASPGQFKPKPVQGQAMPAIFTC